MSNLNGFVHCTVIGGIEAFDDTCEAFLRYYFLYNMLKMFADVHQWKMFLQRSHSELSYRIFNELQTFAIFVRALSSEEISILMIMRKYIPELFYQNIVKNGIVE